MSTVGYYSMTLGQGDASQVDEITNAGHNAINLTSLSAAELGSIDILYIVNPSNDFFGSEYISNLGNIQAAVNAGMGLVIFDRLVTGADEILPGGPSTTFVRDLGADIDVAAGAPSDFVSGAAGTITNTAYDGGNSSSHGYANASTLPAGATALLTTGNASEVTAFSYQYGQGSVFYSTIPIDYYSEADRSQITPGEVSTLVGNALEHVGGVANPVYTDTDDVFANFGEFGLFSALSLAVYELQAHEVTGNFNAAAAPAADALDGPLYFLQTSDLPSLIPVASGNPDFPQNGLVDGYYTNGNSAAMVGRTDDALFVSFRGTNDSSDMFPDWAAQFNHINDLADLMLAVTDYLDDNTEITNVYLTGHSLGSSMADYWTSILNGSSVTATIENVSFAAPGVFTNLPEFDNAASFRMQNDIIALPAAISDNFGDMNLIRNNLLGPISFVDIHSMHVYNQYVTFIQSQGITLENMTELFHGVDYDTLIAHALVVNEPALNLNVGAGANLLYGGGSHEIILGGAGEDIIIGNGGVDHLDGGTGSDFISGSSGRDYLFGDTGNDTLHGNAGNDVIEGEGGSDLITGQGGNDTLYGGGANDDINGGANADELYGGDGGDTLNGGAQADIIDGGLGADTIIGGTGRDTMTGGNGGDTFVFNSTGETNATVRDNGHALTGSADLITDFNAANDVIDLSEIDALRFRIGDTFTFVGEADLIAFDRGELSYYHSNGFTIVHGSNDGDIWSDFAIRLTGEHDLTEANFIL